MFSKSYFPMLDVIYLNFINFMLFTHAVLLSYYIYFNILQVLFCVAVLTLYKY